MSSHPPIPPAIPGVMLKHKETRQFDIVNAGPIAGGVHGPVYIVKKHKLDDPTKVSTYILKPMSYAVVQGYYKETRHKDQNIPVYESIAGDFMGLFNRDVFTKSRVVSRLRSDGIRRSATYVISEKFEGDFVPAKRMTDGELCTVKSNPVFKKQLAALMVGAYMGAEADLHAGNWGVIKDSSGKIVKLIKIDHDMAFFDKTARYYGFQTVRPNQIGNFLSFVFDSGDRHDIISDDLRTFPSLLETPQN